jgi:hypothetical protein
MEPRSRAAGVRRGVIVVLVLVALAAGLLIGAEPLHGQTGRVMKDRTAQLNRFIPAGGSRPGFDNEHTNNHTEGVSRCATS